MALGRSAPLFTLWLTGQRAELWDASGRVLVALEPWLPVEPSERVAWVEALKQHLPKHAPVQLIFATETSEVVCQEAPYLAPREQRAVAERLIAATRPAESMVVAPLLERDVLAEGGHQLWACAHPEREVRLWISVLTSAGANVLFATPWERAYGAAQDTEEPTALHAVVEAGQGRILVFKGRGLLLARSFALPAEVDLGRLDAVDADLLAETLGEEATRVLQFVKQKHRGIAFESVGIVGLSELPEALVERLGRGLRLTVSLVEPSFRQRLLRGCTREWHHRGLNLLPQDILEARQRRAFRMAVWTAVAAIWVGVSGVYLVLTREERALQQALLQAQQAREQRRVLKEAAERAGALRLGILRLRKAEARQADVTERIERLGLVLFQVPDGITLERVEVVALPGDASRFRWEVEGVARTQGGFSVGPLARYLNQVAAHPGMQLEPLREVKVSDRVPSDGGRVEHAVTRFRMAGVAP